MSLYIPSEPAMNTTCRDPEKALETRDMLMERPLMHARRTMGFVSGARRAHAGGYGVGGER